jgi:hypothetical protein
MPERLGDAKRVVVSHAGQKVPYGGRPTQGSFERALAPRRGRRDRRGHLATTGAAQWVTYQVATVEDGVFRQETRGRPGENTRVAAPPQAALNRQVTGPSRLDAVPGLSGIAGLHGAELDLRSQPVSPRGQRRSG